jgi:hypothetical protein
MTDVAPTLVHDDASEYADDTSEYAAVTVIALGIASLLDGLASIIPPQYAAAADVPSLAQFYLWN